jgi:hypothetical protein
VGEPAGDLVRFCCCSCASLGLKRHLCDSFRCSFLSSIATVTTSSVTVFNPNVVSLRPTEGDKGLLEFPVKDACDFVGLDSLFLEGSVADLCCVGMSGALYRLGDRGGVEDEELDEDELNEALRMCAEGCCCFVVECCDAEECACFCLVGVDNVEAVESGVGYVLARCLLEGLIGSTVAIGIG